MHHADRLAHALLPPHRLVGRTHVVVEHHHLLRAGDVFYQAFDLGVVDAAHFLRVVEIRHRRIVAGQGEALGV